MKIKFSQVYTEPDADFNLSHMVLELLSGRLGRLNRAIPHYTELFESKEYTLVFVISASSENERTDVRGPVLLKKRRIVEFVLWIPYRELTFSPRISYVLPCIAQGIIRVFHQYEVDASKIVETVQTVVDIILADPAAYQYDESVYG